MFSSILIDNSGKIVKYIYAGGVKIPSGTNPDIPLPFNIEELNEELKGIEEIGEWKILNLNANLENTQMVLGTKTLYNGELVNQVIYTDRVYSSEFIYTILNNLLNFLECGFILLSPDGYVQFIDNRAKQCLGLPAFINIIGSNILNSKTLRESGLSEMIEEAINSAEIKRYRTQFVDLSARSKNLFMIVNPLSIKDDNVVIITIMEEKEILNKDEIWFKGIENLNHLSNFVIKSLSDDEPSKVIQDGLNYIVDLLNLDCGIIFKKQGNKLTKKYKCRKNVELEIVINELQFEQNLLDWLSNKQGLIFTDLSSLSTSDLIELPESTFIAKEFPIDDTSIILSVVNSRANNNLSNIITHIEGLMDLIFAIYKDTLQRTEYRFNRSLSSVEAKVKKYLRDDEPDIDILDRFNEHIRDEFNLVFSAVYSKSGNSLIPISHSVSNDYSEKIEFLDVIEPTIEISCSNSYIKHCPLRFLKKTHHSVIEDMYVTLIGLNADGENSGGVIVMGFEKSPPKGWVDFVERNYTNIQSTVLIIIKHLNIQRERIETRMLTKILRTAENTTDIKHLVKKLSDELETAISIYIPPGKNYPERAIIKSILNIGNFENEIKSLIEGDYCRNVSEECIVISNENIEEHAPQLSSQNIVSGFIVNPKTGGKHVCLWNFNFTKQFSEISIANLCSVISRITDNLEKERYLNHRFAILKVIRELRLSDMNLALFKMSIPPLAHSIEKLLDIDNLCFILTIKTDLIIEYGSGIFNIFVHPGLKKDIINFIEELVFLGRETTKIIKPSDNPLSNSCYLYVFRALYTRKPNYILVASERQLDENCVAILEDIAYELWRIPK